MLSKQDEMLNFRLSFFLAVTFPMFKFSKKTKKLPTHSPLLLLSSLQNPQYEHFQAFHDKIRRVF